MNFCNCSFFLSLADEMEEKLKEVESKWSSQLEVLKSREKETLRQLEIEKEMLLKEKEELEKEIVKVSVLYFFQLKS